VPPGTPTAINAWILNLAMPAVILLYVPHIRWSLEALLPLGAPFLITAGAGLWVTLVGRPMGWDQGQRTAVFLTSGLGNTSFVGFPLILAYYGAEALPTGVLADQASFFLLATAGIGAAAVFQAAAGAGTPGRSVGRTIAGRLLSFPPLLTFPVALLWPQDGGLAALEPLLKALGATLAPLALFSVGIQLSFSQVRAGGGSLGVGLFYKLVLAPVLVLGLALALGLRGEVVTITVFEAAMAPMITSAVVAGEYGAAPRLANAMVGLGIPLSLVTTGLWWWVLKLVVPAA
jgi:predicted permease